MKKIITHHQKNLIVIAAIMLIVSTFLFYRGITERMVQEETQNVESVLENQERKFKQKQRVAASTEWLVKDDFLFVDTESQWAVYNPSYDLIYPKEIADWSNESKMRLRSEMKDGISEVRTFIDDKKIFGIMPLNLDKNDDMKYLVFSKDLLIDYQAIYVQTVVFSMNVAFILILMLVLTTIYFYNLQKEEEMKQREIMHLKDRLKRRKREYKQYVRQTSKLMYHLIIGVMTINSRQEITMVNPALNEMLEENLYGFIGKNYQTTISSKEMKKYIQKAFAEQEPLNAKLMLFNERERILDLNIIPLKNNINHELDLIVLLYDTTEIHRLEKVRTDFVANASHELRTPITAIKGFSETLLDGAMYDPTALKEFIEIIDKEATRLDSIVNDILQISKLEQHAVSLHVETVDVAQVVQEILLILKQKFEMKQMTCHFDVANSLILKTSRNQLKQILINLISNAISYTPEGGEVVIELEDMGTNGIIKVSDNGIGMDPSEFDRIFERFYRIDKGRSRNVGGTGLGLSIVRWLVGSLRGRIEVESEVDKGSTFAVILPKVLTLDEEEPS
ncbi:two-component system histidine kinase PnpS [Allofustis seminis]|uniref:two-component system histidine kinase PnpS n=1 Tax=Allofustis seminis TaxID=166939 RepID=UPI000371AE22|nr:ATP-binding protein [Allofustis seminis]